jgi:hypothetical protein
MLLFLAHSLSRNLIGSEGAAALAPALTNGALTGIDVHNNNIAGDGAVQLSAAVLGNLKIEEFNKIPIKEMRADSFTELDLKGKGVGVEGGMVIAGLIPVMGALTVTNLLGNQLDAASAKMLAEVAKQKGISLCGIRRDQTTAEFSSQSLKPPDAILLASDLSQAVVTGGLTKLSLAHNMLREEGTKAICEALEQSTSLKELDICGSSYDSNIGGSAGARHVAKMVGVNGGLTALNLSQNYLKDEGVSAICKAIQSNKETKLASLNFKNNGISPVGANAVAAMVAVTGGLTSLDLSNNALCGVTYKGGTLMRSPPRCSLRLPSRRVSRSAASCATRPPLTSPTRTSSRPMRSCWRRTCHMLLSQAY